MSAPLPVIRGFGETMRRDAWWMQPAATLVVYVAFIIYGTWAGLQGNNYESGPYLSPMYSPLIFGDSHHAWFGPQPGWWPAAIPFSAAFFILWAPLGFRFTCYYYRGAYYKAFWADPPGCSVGEPRKGYRGEKKFPLIIQNIHRYFVPFAIALIVILAWDTFKATQFTNAATGQTEFGVGLGTIVLAVNVVFLGGYTFGCHSLRHMVGGYLDRLARRPVQRAVYNGVCTLNKRHYLWAWTSLFAVAFADIYVRLCAMGIWTDWRIL